MLGLIAKKNTVQLLRKTK